MRADVPPDDVMPADVVHQRNEAQHLLKRLRASGFVIELAVVVFDAASPAARIAPSIPCRRTSLMAASSMTSRSTIAQVAVGVRRSLRLSPLRTCADQGPVECLGLAAAGLSVDRANTLRVASRLR